MFSTHYTWSDFSVSLGLAIVAVLILMADAFCKKFPRRGYAIIGGLSLVASGSYFAPSFIAGLVCFISGLCMLFAFDYNSVSTRSVSGNVENDEGTGELYALMLIAVAGICALCQARDLVMLFISLEILTLSSYIMVGYYRRNLGSIEAGVKYLIQGALSTGILVFGAAWYFGVTGGFAIDSMAMSTGMQFSPAALIFSLILMTLGILFKIGAVPMSAWVPDVYQGAPTPVTAFLSTCSKIAGFIALLAIFTALPKNTLFGSNELSMTADSMGLMMLIITCATLLVGNLSAIGQRNAKRLLAYSSIGQAGFILVFVYAMTQTNFDRTVGHYIHNIETYLFAYSVSVLAAFIAIGIVRMARESEEVSAFRGLGRSNPYFAFCVTVVFASLAGVPLTFGFSAKLSSFITAINSPMAMTLLPFLIIGAAVGFYYYFKVIRSMYWEKAEEGVPAVRVPLTSGIIMGLLVVLIIAGGLNIF